MDGCDAFSHTVCLVAAHAHPANLGSQCVYGAQSANGLVLKRMNIADWLNFPSGNEKITSGNEAIVVPSLP